MDAAIARLNPQGTSLVWSTLIGGTHFEWLGGLALGPDNGAIISGTTLSVNFPLTPGVAGVSPTGSYLTWIDATGTALRYSTYLGQLVTPGAGGVDAQDVSIDSSGVATVTGIATNMIMTPGAIDNSHNGNWDVGVWRVSPSGDKSYYGTYLGGSGEEYPTGVVATHSGRITVTGRTLSANYPTTPGAYSPTSNGGSEAFLTTFEPYLQGVEPYRDGTPSCHGALVTNATEMPQAGASAFSLYLGGAPSFSRGVCLIATAPSAGGVPFFNTTLWLDPASIMGRVAVFTDSLGFTETALPLTSVASGTQLWAQYFVRNSADCPDGRLAASQALHLTVQ